MKIKLSILNTVSVFLIVILGILIIIKPQVGNNGVAAGILICGRVVIPSLFPFTMCVIFLQRSGILKHLNRLTPVTKALFRLTGYEFSVMLLSFIGGYPLGAKLLSNAVENHKISPKTAEVMLYYCVNAGPAFIVTAVGSGILGSKAVGYILLVSHIAASLLLSFFCRFFIIYQKRTESQEKNISPAENFVVSACDAASSVTTICAFVILFSGVNAYIDFFASNIHFLKFVSLFTEVTNAVFKTNNICTVSFLLGFAGISIWCQVVALKGKIRINFPFFILFRFFHGALSAVFSISLVEILGITLPTVSNSRSFIADYLYSTPALSVAMLAMGTVFVISLATKKYANNILNEIV